MPESPIPFNFHCPGLAPLLERFLTLRRRLGYSVDNKALIYVYRELDAFFSFYGLSKPSDIDEPHAFRWMFAIPSQSATTKNIRLQRLRSFCAYLVQIGLLKEDPSRRIPFLRQKPYPKPHLYSLQELGAMLHVAHRWTSRHNHHFPGLVMAAFIHLVYASGLRLGEALNLKLKDFDPDENTLALWNTKFHKERLVPLSQDSADRLSHFLFRRSLRYPNQCRPDDFIFCHKNGQYSRVGMFYLFRNLLREAGLAQKHGPRIHDLRHTFAVHRLYKWYQDGADPLNKLPDLSTFMGHACFENTQVYLTITKDLLREGDKRFQALAEDTAKKQIPLLPRLPS
ncbi:MAG: tyrosine-type recombinase/integrase [Elusimicrobia bacterium]|nr:tyrosine-type recombinase/integrase [Elusimicrobiota bacterium]